MQTAEIQLLVATIRQGNKTAACGILKNFIENNNLGLERLYQNFSEEEAGVLKQFLRDEETRNFLSSVIEERITGIGREFHSYQN